jgi:serine/threonine protein kinase
MFAKQNDIRSLNLIDFGLSGSYKGSANLMFTKRYGTVIYMAPEIFNESSYTKVSQRYYRLVCGHVKCRNDNVHIANGISSSL